MKRVPTTVWREDSGLAGIEFALVIPVLLVLLAGMADFALAFWNRGLLANSVAQGAQYAFLAGPNVSASSIQGIVKQRLALPEAGVTVAGPDCRCVSGTPAAASVQTCNQQCPDGRLPGTYVTITARYTYEPILPSYSRLANTLLTETAKVRLR